MATGAAFRVIATDGAARRGVLSTPHGDVETPAFMPVGTRGAVKGLTARDLEGLGAQIVLANTYHLHLRPGEALISAAGGLHSFMGWERAILTDSGGYQAYSLAERRRITPQGIAFRSHLDGSERLLTPESAVEIQAALGADIAMALDECLGYPASEEQTRASMELSLSWARRSRARFLELAGEAGCAPSSRRPNPGQALFGIVQGGASGILRAESAGRTVAIGFEGYAIGGLSVGEPAEIMYKVIEETAPLLPEASPRYLMGAGTPSDIFSAVERGIDLFDCVLPTRNARNGQLFTSEGRLNIKNARYASDLRPPDERCACYTCRRHSRAYLRHLFLSGEMTAAVLNTLHNLHFYLDTMQRIRDALVFGTFRNLKRSFEQSSNPPIA
ncbi:MAG: tRNA guanosine(34) transglycosylase Tgt [Vicinamibacterales bacterium]